MTTTKQHQFWRLDGPESQTRLAEWDDEMDYLETIHCPVDPGHQRAGRRMPNLSVALPGSDADDFVWTWKSECLIQDRVLRLFRERRVTGFEVKPVSARFVRSKKTPPVLWELVVTGWAGMASPESGVMLNKEKSCSVCGHLTYTGLTDNSKLIKPEQWDGSDMFLVWPLPKFVFITDRLCQLIETHSLTGCRFVKPNEFNEMDGFSPGRLSYSMPETRARELGEPLGIY